MASGRVKMRLYLAGPMRGIDKWNFPRFHDAAANLRAAGYEVISPAEIDEALGLDPNDYPDLPEGWYSEALDRDFACIDKCDGIVMLEDWWDSNGALAEVHHAEAQGIAAQSIESWFFPRTEQSYRDRRVDPAEYADGSEATRVFESGARRGTAEGKLDIEAMLSPRVLRAYCAYLDKHRTMADGSRRPGDNWQNGIPAEEYVKSLARHFFDFWEAHRGGEYDEDALNACLFNLMGYAFEKLEGR